MSKVKNLRICVYAIAKDEALFAQRFCEAAKDADLIFVVDTGSQDATVEILQAHGAVVNSIHISPWRFDDARNAALALLPQGIDVCFSLDLDEVLQPGWRKEVERIWKKGETTRMRYGFDWTGAGENGIQFQYDKVHARHGYRWKHSCHEIVVPDRIAEVWAETDKLLVVHRPDPTKSRGQYLDLLKVSIEEDPIDPRNAFYYARELSFHRRWDEAIAECQRYLALPGATWDGERCYAMRVVARCYEEKGWFEEGLNWARRATAEAPNTREPWVEVARLAYRLSRWEECLGAALSALKITERAKVYTCDPEVWGAPPHDYAAIAAWHLGLHALSETHAAIAADLNPSDDRLIANLRLIRGDEKAAA